jgi:hypothetical protein
VLRRRFKVQIDDNSDVSQPLLRNAEIAGLDRVTHCALQPAGA